MEYPPGSGRLWGDTGGDGRAKGGGGRTDGTVRRCVILRVRKWESKVPSPGIPLPLQAARPGPQEVIDEHDSDHRLAHRYEPGKQARVVPAFDQNLRRLPGPRHRRLAPRDARGRLDGDPADDRHARRDAPEHSAVAVGGRGDFW